MTHAPSSASAKTNTTKSLEDYKAPYPKPTADQRRYVIYLEEHGVNEGSQYRLQLIPGRMAMVDGVNYYALSGNVEEKTIDGWGYPYYVVKAGEMASTLMAPLGDTKPVSQFVPITDQPMIRYNSKLPVVVYTPKDMELRYRIWAPTAPTAEIATEV
ncbi:Proteinase inhibitor I11 [Trypanosoma melophagium]|uniref:Proteinase inhibitor I11 n=1 Tax=Trypanosoma melophagium TaxID=715481 RepID=UPI00351A9A0B|nr:Proteinase inhibitor I11 [Trypanosoma melophagium]